MSPSPARPRPGNRVLFSCRSLDYAAPLSTPALRVPQVQIEPLSDAQVEAFLAAYSPLRGVEIWAAVRGTPQLEALRSPFFLALLVDQVEATGELAEDRAGLFTGFVRQALRREVERDTPDGVSNLSGNVNEWTLSLWGEDDDHESEIPEFAYPYQADDGREDPPAPPSAARVVRGGSWRHDRLDARASFRGRDRPGSRGTRDGFRLVISSPIS